VVEETHRPCPQCERQVTLENLEYHVSFAHREGGPALPEPTPEQLAPRPLPLDPEEVTACAQCGVTLKAGLLDYHMDHAHPPPPSLNAPAAASRAAETRDRFQMGLLGGGVVLWKVLGFVLSVVAVVAFIWGGTNDAKARCLAHEFGDSSFVGSLACTVRH
jgi:hypothetical protein